MKRLVLLLAVLLLVVPVAGVAAQDQTIVDVAAGNADFSTLVALVEAAGLVDTLKSDGPFTVFAPTNAAFAALPAPVVDYLTSEAGKDTLTSILTYHVVAGKVMSADVTSGDVASVEGDAISLTVSDAGVRVENAAVVTADIEASNGVIHVIDAVILPESQTIADLVVAAASAEEGAEFTTLLAAVQAADPAVLETLSNPDAELTVFAPTDAAFAAVGADTLNAVLADQALLTNILLYHVVPGVVPSGDLGQLLAENMSMDGLMVNTALDGAQVKFMVAEDGSVKINDATIVVTDIDAGNGVIHVIDAVILPPSE